MESETVDAAMADLLAAGLLLRFIVRRWGR
jgi:hypothetical protein